MASYQPAQEFNNLKWGTMMPVTVMVNSAVVQLRARGIFSAIVADPAKLSAEIPDPEDAPSYLQSFAVSAITETIGVLSGSASDVRQLTTVTPKTVEAFQTALNSKLQSMGLQIKSANIEAIESL
jgi:membrane protease subunit (stomatin/prohibitin family)